MAIHIRLQHSAAGPSSWCKANKTLPVTALYDLELLLNSFELLVCIHGFHGMQENGWLSPMELTDLILWLRLWCWLVTLGRLHICHHLLHGLQHLCLHVEYLLQCWWWWRVSLVVVIVSVCVTAPGDGHLKHRGVHDSRDEGSDKDDRGEHGKETNRS
jgi:hypothetical protein